MQAVWRGRTTDGTYPERDALRWGGSQGFAMAVAGALLVLLFLADGRFYPGRGLLNTPSDPCRHVLSLQPPPGTSSVPLCLHHPGLQTQGGGLRAAAREGGKAQRRLLAGSVRAAPQHAGLWVLPVRALVVQAPLLTQAGATGPTLALAKLDRRGLGVRVGRLDMRCLLWW